MGPHEPLEAAHLGAVQRIGRLGERRRAAHLARQRGEGHVVARKAGAAVAHRPAQVLLADPGVQPQRGRHDVHVGARQPLAHLRQHVGVGDLGRHEGVDRELRQLGVDEGHASRRRLAPADRPVEILEDLPRSGIGLADQEEVRAQEPLDHVAERDELGVVAEAEVDTALAPGGLLESGPHPALRVTRHHGAGERHDVEGGLLPKGGPDLRHDLEDVLQREPAVRVARGGDDHVREVGLCHRLPRVGGGREATPAAVDHLLQARLLDRGPAGVDLAHEVVVDVHPDHGVPLVGDHRGERRAELSETDHRYTHLPLAPSPVRSRRRRCRHAAAWRAGRGRSRRASPAPAPSRRRCR